MRHDRLELIAQANLADPENYDQEYFYHNTPCGTACCFAGRAVALFHPKGKEIQEEYFKNNYDAVVALTGGAGIWGSAAELLELNEDQAQDLFSAVSDQICDDDCGDPDCELCAEDEGWPQEWCDKYNAAKTGAERAQVGADYIRYFSTKEGNVHGQK